MEVLSLVRARVALSWKFLHRRELHVLVLGGCRQEGAGLLFGSGLASAARDVDERIDGARQTNSWIAKPLPGNSCSNAAGAAEGADTARGEPASRNWTSRLISPAPSSWPPVRSARSRWDGGPEPHKANSWIPMSHREAKGRASRVEPPTGSLSFVARSIRSSVRIWRSLRSNASNCSRTTLSSIPSLADRLVLSVIYAPRNNFVILQEKRHTLAKTGPFRCPEPTRGLT